jgi:hypothetical protein
MLNLGRILNQDRLTRDDGTELQSVRGDTAQFYRSLPPRSGEAGRRKQTISRRGMQGNLGDNARQTALHFAVLQMLSHLRFTERLV